MDQVARLWSDAVYTAAGIVGLVRRVATKRANHFESDWTTYLATYLEVARYTIMINSQCMCNLYYS